MELKVWEQYHTVEGQHRTVGVEGQGDSVAVERQQGGTVGVEGQQDGTVETEGQQDGTVEAEGQQDGTVGRTVEGKRGYCTSKKTGVGEHRKKFETVCLHLGGVVLELFSC